MKRTAVHIYCGVRTQREGGVERRGEAKAAITSPLWYCSAYHCCYCFVLFLWSAIPSPASGVEARVFGFTPVILLSYTHCGLMWGCGMLFFAACCAVLYCVSVDRHSSDGYESCCGLRIYSQALLRNFWHALGRRVRALRSPPSAPFLSPLCARIQRL